MPPPAAVVRNGAAQPAPAGPHAAGQRHAGPPGQRHVLDAQTDRLQSVPGPKGDGLGLGCIGGWVGHTGEFPGFNTSVTYDTIADTSVVVMTNGDISSGKCSESPTLNDHPTGVPCASPATRMFVAVSTAIGHTFQAIPAA